MVASLVRDHDPRIALLVGLSVVQVVVVEILIQAGSVAAEVGIQVLFVMLVATVATILGLGLRSARRSVPSP